MAGALSIRLAAPGDLDAARELVRDAALPLDGFDEAAQVFVADRDGRIVGVAALEDHGAGAGRALLLRSVAVAPDARGSGVGTALVHAALRSAEQHGVPVSLLTETAPDYFPRFGFQAVDRRDLASALRSSKELQGACAVSARAFVREPPVPPVR